LAFLTVGYSQKEHSDSSTKDTPPIAKPEVITEQKETIIATKQIVITNENEAIDLVRKQIDTDKLYEWSKQGKCLVYFVETTTDKNYDIAVREKHGDSCEGDPKTSPLVDRFRIDRATGKLTWYYLEDGDYVDCSTMKSVKEEQARRVAALRKSV
jgi:hypothetical protein